MSAPNLSIGAMTVAEINDKLNYIAGRIQKLFAKGNGALDTTGNAATSDHALFADLAINATNAALAAAATKLATARAINGVNFDGTAPITVTANASTLSGTALAAGVISAKIKLLDLASIPPFANNAAAIAGGLASGNLYRTGADPDILAIVH